MDESPGDSPLQGLVGVEGGLNRERTPGRGREGKGGGGGEQELRSKNSPEPFSIFFSFSSSFFPFFFLLLLLLLCSFISCQGKGESGLLSLCLIHLFHCFLFRGSGGGFRYSIGFFLSFSFSFSFSFFFLGNFFPFIIGEVANGVANESRPFRVAELTTAG